MTEIYDYLRLLYARLGEIYCPDHNIRLSGQSEEEMVSDIIQAFKGKLVQILSPMARGKKGEFVKEFQDILIKGFDKARVNGEWKDIGQMKKLSKRQDHYIEVLNG